MTNSDAFTFIDFIWQRMKSPSWLRINDGMERALLLAIQSGLRFELGDISRIAKAMRSQFWMDDEAAYARSVEARNTSACLAFERYLKREAWIVGGARLAVGSECPWGVVTSMGVVSFVACTYANGRQGKPLKRNKVTRLMVKDWNAGARAASKATVMCGCGCECEDRRSGSGWHKGGRNSNVRALRRAVDKCRKCGQRLPPVEIA